MTAVAVAMGLLLGVMLLLRPTSVTIDELAVRDCLYIRPGSAGTAPAEEVLLRVSGGTPAIPEFAERASCTASHSHEVVRVLDLGGPAAAYPDDGASLTEATADCVAALAALTGAGTTSVVVELLVPSPEGWGIGLRTGVCVAGRTDGGFLDQPLRDPGG